MTQHPQECPKCGGSMEQGFVLDNAHGGRRFVSQWASGPPETSFWMGTKHSNKNLIPIGAFRCASCGYLEHYARKEFAPR